MIIALHAPISRDRTAALVLRQVQLFAADEQ